jgi:hypothetical protein
MRDAKIYKQKNIYLFFYTFWMYVQFWCTVFIFLSPLESLNTKVTFVAVTNPKI